MEPLGTLAIAGTVAALINNIYLTIMTVKSIHDQMKGADAQLTSIVSQMSTIKAALAQIQDLLSAAQYNEQLQSDLELALHATHLHVEFINSKLSKFRFKSTTSTLKFGSRAKMVFNSEDINACLMRLNHQATALNLLITVLTSKSVTEQRAMLQRSNTRKVFKQIQEDKASLLDETETMPSIQASMDHKSVRPTVPRTISHPSTDETITKDPSINQQLQKSKPYRRFFRRRASDKAVAVQSVAEIEPESIADDAETLVEDLETDVSEVVKPKLDLQMPRDGRPRFSKMLALGHTQRSVSRIVGHAQSLFNPDNAISDTSGLTRKHSAQMHRLITQYFDLSISSHTLDEYSREFSDVVLLDWYSDVSTVLFVADVSIYRYDIPRLERDLELFAKIAKDYHLWLAKIVLYLETTGLDPYTAGSLSEDFKERFMQAGKGGASGGRIHIVVGESNETAAGTIFSVCNESERLQENKWAGLTRSPTF